MLDFSGKVAFVAGAGSVGPGWGNGKATAALLARRGAKVFGTDIAAEAIAETESVIAQEGHTFVGHVCDMTESAHVKAAVDACMERFGRIDVLVNNVAISDNKSIREITLAEWNRTIAVTLTSQFLCSKYVAEQMIEQGDGGAIVNIGSTSGFQGRSRAVAYAAAKGGVANLMRALAVQLAPYRIRVNSVVPNKIGSPVGREEFDPSRPVPNLIGRAGLPQELARAVLFMASDESSFIAGENLVVDGGLMAMMTGGS